MSAGTRTIPLSWQATQPSSCMIRQRSSWALVGEGKLLFTCSLLSLYFYPIHDAVPVPSLREGRPMVIVYAVPLAVRKRVLPQQRYATSPQLLCLLLCDWFDVHSTATRHKYPLAEWYPGLPSMCGPHPSDSMYHLSYLSPPSAAHSNCTPNL